MLDSPTFIEELLSTYLIFVLNEDPDLDDVE
jgi:hypothetical protein